MMERVGGQTPALSLDLWQTGSIAAGLETDWVSKVSWQLMPFRVLALFSCTSTCPTALSAAGYNSGATAKGA